MLLFFCVFFLVCPLISLGPGTGIYRQGESGNLTCKIVEGLPEPQLSWYKNNVFLPNEVNTTLVLANVTERDEGTYTCRAQNAGGDFKASIDVTVESKLMTIIMYNINHQED